MFQRLFGMLVSSLVIFFPVVRGGDTVRMCGKVVEFGGALVRVSWHSFPALGGQSSLELSQLLYCPILNSTRLRAQRKALHFSNCRT